MATPLFESPKDIGKKATGSVRSVRSHKSSSSKASTASDKSLCCDLLGVQTKCKEPTWEPGAHDFSSAASIASGSRASSTSSEASTATKISTKSSISSLTEHDLFGTKLPPTEKELAPSAPDAVELAGQAYKVPEPIDKQFYRDLTCLEDDELIKKYGLIEVQIEDFDQRNQDGCGAKKTKRFSKEAIKTKLDIKKFL